MENTPLTVIDIKNITHAVSGPYANFSVGNVNDHVVRVSVMMEPYYWHYHPNSDESFLVMEGVLVIELEDKLVELLPGQLFTIPKNVKHRTRPKAERSVNITFERRDMETVKTPED